MSSTVHRMSFHGFDGLTHHRRRLTLIVGLVVAALSWFVPTFSHANATAQVRENTDSNKPADGLYIVNRWSIHQDELLPLYPAESLLEHNPKWIVDQSTEPLVHLTIIPDQGIEFVQGLTIRSVQRPNGQTRLQFTLPDDSARKLRELSRKYLGRQVAVVINGEAVTLHKVRAIIKNGNFSLTRCTDEGCRVILERLAKNPDNLDQQTSRQSSQEQRRTLRPMTGEEWLAESEPWREGVLPSLIRIEANDELGFHFPYFLYVPRSLDCSQPTRLLVEPNNTGSSDDDFQVHEEAARRLAAQSHATHLSERLGTPLLVPVFPRPHENWRIYTHALDRDSLLVESGKLARLDQQLIAMVAHARNLFDKKSVSLGAKVLMHGYSASGTFSNRFAALHPDQVKAVASGGVNGMPLLPVSELEGTHLPFPIGVADVQELTGRAFNRQEYEQVAQWIYMGGQDENDTLPYDDAWNDDERSIIVEVLGKPMMPDRWERSQAIFANLNLPVRLVTYDDAGHELQSKMLDDIVEFFRTHLDRKSSEKNSEDPPTAQNTDSQGSPPNPLMKKVTAILLTDDVDACIEFWKHFGLKPTATVPHGQSTGFAILAADEVELMYQSFDSARADVPKAIEGITQSIVYVKVDSLDAILKVVDAENLDVVIPERKTFYGAREVFVRDPAGNVVGFAEHGDDE